HFSSCQKPPPCDARRQKNFVRGNAVEARGTRAVRAILRWRLAESGFSRKVEPLNSQTSLHTLLCADDPLLVLAPMQDVTDLPFWRLMTRYGGADLYCTEYFRVHPDSRFDPDILASITQNPTGRPVVAQMMGNDIPSLVRAAKELQQHPIAAVDLNLGCPVPVVYRKCAGGGLLRDPARVDSILGALRDAVTIPFTVKTRLGFEDSSRFDELLAIS